MATIAKPAYYTVRQIFKKSNGVEKELWWNGKDSFDYTFTAKSWRTEKAALINAVKASEKHPTFETYVDCHSNLGVVFQTLRVN